MSISPEWIEDCLKWRGEVLTGKFGHWCHEFDGLPVDETCGREWDICTCYTPEEKAQKDDDQHTP